MTGRPLAFLLPYGLTVASTSSGDYHVVEPPDRSFAGRLLLPFAAENGVTLVELLVPSSGAFSQEDLIGLWSAGRQLAAWRSRRAVSADDNSYATPTVVGQADVLADWHALDLCSREAERLLQGWPNRVGRDLRWVPLGVGGGWEDVGLTEREASRLGFGGRRDGVVILDRSARWFGKHERLTLNAIASLGREVVTMVQSALIDNDLAAVGTKIAPIHTVASLASGPGADPDPSSWPVPFVRFAASCMRVLAELVSTERGGGAVPLLDTDELYEAWLAFELRRLLSLRLPPAPVASPGSLASWTLGNTTIDLRLKPAIGRSSQIGAHRYRALVAHEMVPDVMVTATRSGVTEIAVLDAKAWRRMLPEQVLAESAKYLYGIRRADSLDVPVLNSVHLVSCAPTPHLPDAEDARIGYVHVTPTSAGNQLALTVERVLTELDAQIDNRLAAHAGLAGF